MNRSNLSRDPAPLSDAGAVLLAHAAVALRGAIVNHLTAHPGAHTLDGLATALCATPDFLGVVAAGLEADGALVREPAGWRLAERPA